MEWISVEDRLPEAGKRVLIYNGKYIDVTCCIDTEISPVTHWMPLPEPLKPDKLTIEKQLKAANDRRCNYIKELETWIKRYSSCKACKHWKKPTKLGAKFCKIGGCEYSEAWEFVGLKGEK